MKIKEVDEGKKRKTKKKKRLRERDRNGEIQEEEERVERRKKENQYLLISWIATSKIFNLLNCNVLVNL